MGMQRKFIQDAWKVVVEYDRLKNSYHIACETVITIKFIQNAEKDQTDQNQSLVFYPTTLGVNALTRRRGKSFTFFNTKFVPGFYQSCFQQIDWAMRRWAGFLSMLLHGRYVVHKIEISTMRKPLLRSIEVTSYLHTTVAPSQQCGRAHRLGGTDTDSFRTGIWAKARPPPSAHCSYSCADCFWLQNTKKQTATCSYSWCNHWLL